MIQRALVAIAGVDRGTLKTCPATDKVWATHLGFALCLSFVVVFGISFHATGYMIADPYMRGAVALVIALTMFMFDRALYQSDWFDQGFLWQSGPQAAGDAGGARPARRFLRIAIRLGMSFGLAWVIACSSSLRSSPIRSPTRSSGITSRSTNRSNRRSSSTRPRSASRSSTGAASGFAS